MSDPLLELDDVHVTFGAGRDRVRAVDGVSLRIEPGEVVALVGESGCGKTTLIRSIVGLEDRTGGTVTFEGRPVGSTRRELRRVRRGVQMVFQDPTGALNPRHTIGDAVAEGIHIHGLHRGADEAELVADALSRAGLRPPERFVDRYPHEVSGGQRQRVLIAGAIALGPRLLLADEPVASLDASIRGEILALLRSLVDEVGLSIVAVTHDIGLAWNVADRIAVMYLGRIVELGTVEEVLAEPAHPYTRALLSVVPQIGQRRTDAGAGSPDDAGAGSPDQAGADSPADPAADSPADADRAAGPQILSGEAPDPANIPPGCRFHPRCPVVASGEAARRGIEARCRGEDPARREVSPGRSVACHLTTADDLQTKDPIY